MTPAKPLDLEVAKQFAKDFKKMKCFSPLPSTWMEALIREIERLRARVKELTTPTDLKEGV